MWIELHRLADYVGRLSPVAVKKAHLVHRIQKLAVRRLKPVDLGNCTGYYDAHSIGHIVDLEHLSNGLIYCRHICSILIRQPCFERVFFDLFVLLSLTSHIRLRN